MHQTATVSTDRYYETVVREGLWHSVPTLKRYIRWLYDGVSLQGLHLLDIGGGAGAFGIYAAVHGATVTLIDPEAEGSFSGIYERFERMAHALGVRDRITHRRQTFQEFEASPGSFDVVASFSSINHMNEPGVVNLRKPGPAGDAARAEYRELIGKMASLAKPGGHLIVTDNPRTHFWPTIGMLNPGQRQIEWAKHQDPTFWAGLFLEAGFDEPDIKWWGTFSRFGLPGYLLLNHKVGAYFAGGHFRLHMRRAGR